MRVLDACCGGQRAQEWLRVAIWYCSASGIQQRRGRIAPAAARRRGRWQILEGMMAQDDLAVRAAIDATNRKFEAAFNAGDPARAAREVYTADARVLPPDMPMVRGREALGPFWVGVATQVGVKHVQLATVELQVHHDVAHEIGTATLTLENGQQLAAKFCVFWKQEDGEWRWDVDIWNSGV
jgi:ketosteroid isomerase-like protein